MVRQVEMEVESIPIDGCFHTPVIPGPFPRHEETEPGICSVAEIQKKQIPGSIADEPAMAPE
jgi:hypothetical protein